MNDRTAALSALNCLLAVLRYVDQGKWSRAEQAWWAANVDLKGLVGEPVESVSVIL